LFIIGEHIVQDIIKKGAGRIIDKIKTPATADLLEAQKETVERRFLASASKGLKALRELDSKVFHVPPHVLLPEHMFFENQFTSEEEEQRTAKLEELKAKYREVTIKNLDINALRVENYVHRFPENIC